jgi:hypothetical protein
MTAPANLGKVPTGYDLKTYFNIGVSGTVTYGTSATWSTASIKFIEDLNFVWGADSPGDISDRQSLIAKTAVGLIKHSIEFTATYKPDDTNFIFLQTCAQAKTPIEVLTVDRPGTSDAAPATTAAYGLQCIYQVTQFDWDQPLKTGSKIKVKLEPTYLSVSGAVVDFTLWPHA